MALIIGVILGIFGGAWIGERFILPDWTYWQWVVVLALLRLVIDGVERASKKGE